MRFALIYNTVGGLKKFRLEQPTITIGALPSNHLVLDGKGVDPIHGLIEKLPDDTWKISDLGSERGIRINGKKIDVETTLQVGDKLKVGQVELHLEKATLAEAAVAKESAVKTPDDQPFVGDVTSSKPSSAPKLFDIKSGEKQPRGKTLEIIAYWGDRVLEIEHYHKPSQKKRVKNLQTEATMGMNPKADFIAAGPHKLSNFVFAKTNEKGYTLRLLDGMEAHLRREGKFKKVKKAGKFKLSSKDIASIEYGPIRYFLLYVNLPKLKLPKHSPRDPLFLALMLIMMLLFITTTATVQIVGPMAKEDKTKNDLWSIVSLTPELKQPPTKKEQPPKPKKKPVNLQKKVPEKKKPIIPLPKPKPKIKPDPKLVKAKSKPKKVVKPQPKKSSLAQLKPPTPKAIDVVTQNKAISKPIAAKPKVAPKITSQLTRGVRSAGGGAKKGTSGAGINTIRGGSRNTQSTTPSGKAGVEGVSNDKASGVNLSQLGQSAGKIFNKAGAGAIQTNFQSSAGGLGGGSGSSGGGRRTHGLGGSLTKSSAVGLSGTNNQISTFGQGGGGLLDKGDSMSGFSRGSGAHRGSVRVHVTAGGAPGIEGGLSSGQVSGVISSNNNQIRNCYERLLKSRPNATGKVKMKIIISGQGRVSSVSTESGTTLNDPELIGCITSRVKKWAFDSPSNGQSVTVNYPWIFRPT